MSGDAACRGTDVVITDDADVDADGVADMCEKRANGSDRSEAPVVAAGGEQLASAADQDEEEARQPAPFTAVEGHGVIRTLAASAGPSGPTVVPFTPTAPALRVLGATRSPQVLGSQVLGSQVLGSQALGSQVLGSQVLGSQVTRSPSALASTGDATTGLVPFGLGLVLLGFAVERNSKRLRAGRVR